MNNQTTNHIHSYFRRDAPRDASQRIIEQHQFGSQLFSCHESSLASRIEEIIDLLFFSLAFEFRCLREHMLAGFLQPRVDRKKPHNSSTRCGTVTFLNLGLSFSEEVSISLSLPSVLSCLRVEVAGLQTRQFSCLLLQTLAQIPGSILPLTRSAPIRDHVSI